MKRSKLGDVFEIETNKGLAYIQYNNHHRTRPKWGPLIRVLQGFYEERPSTQELQLLTLEPHRFQTFFNVNFSLKHEEIALVDNFLVPEFAKKLPIFKQTDDCFKFKQEEMEWYLHDLDKDETWGVGKLSLEEQKKYPKTGLVDIICLKMQIETGMFGNVELC